MLSDDELQALRDNVTVRVLLRFLENATPQPGAPDTVDTTPAEPAALPNGETSHVGTPPIPDDPRYMPFETVAGQRFRLNQ